MMGKKYLSNGYISQLTHSAAIICTAEKMFSITVRFYLLPQLISSNTTVIFSNK